MSNPEETALRAAEHALAEALGAPDRLAWVEHYTEDAVFVGPGGPAVEGRPALLEMARAMQPLSAVSIVPLRTELHGDLAAVYARATWVSGDVTSEGSTIAMRGILVWRRDEGGTWRVAQELLHQDPEAHPGA